MVSSNRLIRPFAAILAVRLLIAILLARGATAQVPTAYPSDTTLTKISVPNPPNPVYLSPITDPTFGTTITRIADQQALGISNQYIRHHYSKDQPWNSDGSLIKLGYPQYPFVILDGRTYTFIRKINLPEESTWSHIDPNKLYGELSGTNKFVSGNATTGAITVLHTFTEYDRISLGNYEGNISNDDHYAALLASKGSTNFIVVYDILNNNVVATLSIGGSGLDWVSMSQSGNYVVVDWGTEGAGPGHGIDVYDRNLNFLQHLRDDTPHGDLGYDTQGNEVFVGLGYVSGATISAFRLDGSGMITLLDNKPGFWGGHLSCRNTKRPGWCYVSDDGWSPDLWLGHDEVFAIKIDSSRTVERFAHEHHSYNAGYDHEPQAVPSRDGTKVMWASDWGGGSYAPVYSYVAEMPVAATPLVVQPPTVTPPAPTAAPPSQPPALPASNLLVNEGFELDANNDGRPDGWQTNSRVTRSNEMVHSGGYAMQHRATDNASYKISQTVKNLNAGTTYTFSGMVNIPSTTDAFAFGLEIRWRDASNHTIRTDQIKTYNSPTSGWDLATASLVAPAKATNALVRMVVSDLNATIYIDDVALHS